MRDPLEESIVLLPFIPLGALLAALSLGAALTVFGLLLRQADRAVTRTAGSILPGLVSGMRDWTEGRRRSPTGAAPTARTVPGASGPSDLPEIVDLP